MTITYPRDLLDPYPWSEQCRFAPTFQQERSRTLGGLGQVADIGREFWVMRYATVPLVEAKAKAFGALLHSLRGGARIFKAWDPLCEYPLAYPKGWGALTVDGDPFTGSGTIDTVNGTLDQLTIDALPVGFVLSAGDKLSFGYGAGGQSLHHIIEGGTANGGGVVTVTVEPTVPISWAENAPVLFARPWCKGLLDPSTVDIAWQKGRKAVVSFAAEQQH